MKESTKADEQSSPSEPKDLDLTLFSPELRQLIERFFAVVEESHEIIQPNYSIIHAFLLKALTQIQEKNRAFTENSVLLKFASWVKHTEAFLEILKHFQQSGEISTKNLIRIISTPSVVPICSTKKTFTSHSYFDFDHSTVIKAQEAIKKIILRNVLPIKTFEDVYDFYRVFDLMLNYPNVEFPIFLIEAILSQKNRDNPLKIGIQIFMQITRVHENPLPNSSNSALYLQFSTHIQQFLENPAQTPQDLYKLLEEAKLLKLAGFYLNEHYLEVGQLNLEQDIPYLKNPSVSDLKKEIFNHPERKAIISEFFNYLAAPAATWQEIKPLLMVQAIFNPKNGFNHFQLKSGLTLSILNETGVSWKKIFCDLSDIKSCIDHLNRSNWSKLIWKLHQLPYLDTEVLLKHLAISHDLDINLETLLINSGLCSQKWSNPFAFSFSGSNPMSLQCH